MKSIERKAQHPQIGLGEIGQAHGRHLAEAQLPCGQHQSPPRNDPPLGINQNRQNETVSIQATRQFAHLLRRMLVGLPPQRLAIRERDTPGSQITRKRVAVSTTMDPTIHAFLLLAKESNDRGRESACRREMDRTGKATPHAASTAVRFLRQLRRRGVSEKSTYDLKSYLASRSVERAVRQHQSPTRNGALRRRPVR
jgi:hypothetical protein